MSEHIKTTDELAQDIMDMYFKEFKEENEDFHDFEFFRRYVRDTRAEILQQDYENAYVMLRGEGVNKSEMVVFTGWIRDAIIEFEEDKETGYFMAKMPGGVFSFKNDNSNTSFQGIMPVRRDECVFSRTTIQQLYLQRHLPKNNVQFWWPEYKECGAVVMVDKVCCKKARVFYIPEDDNAMPLGAANMIKDRILDRLLKNEGKLIDQSNDSNQNVTIQTESNKQQL